jgi:hypothetical protein
MQIESCEGSVRRILVLCLLLSWAATICPAHAEAAKDSGAHQSKATIEGLVRDIACPIQNSEATATHLSMKCLKACARKGSPLVILAKDGELYLPISDKMPDASQREKLMPFLGKYVQATGLVYERKGTRAIVIQEIRAMKNVHLDIVDQ